MTSDCTVVTSGHNGSIRITFISDNNITRKLATGSIHDYLFCYCPLVGTLLEVLRINTISTASHIGGENNNVSAVQ